MRRIILLAAAMLVAVAAVGDAGGEAIRARVRVVKPNEPGVVEVYVTVPPADANRGYQVAVACDGEVVASSFRQLDGETSTGPFAPVVFRELTGCQYAVGAELLGAGGKALARTSPIIAFVLSR